MNTKRVNAAAGVIFAAQKNGHVTPAGWAMALESAQLLQSPETAAEMERLRARIVDLEAELYTEQEHHRTTLEQRNAHAQELRKLRPRVAELEQQVTNQGREQTLTDVGNWLAEVGEKSAAYLVRTVDVPRVTPSLEDPHDSPLHHRYRLGRDLPETAP